MLEAIKNFWFKHETKIVLCLGLVLVSTISFEFGYIRGGEEKKDIMVIERPMQAPKAGSEEVKGAIIQSSGLTAEKTLEKKDSAPGTIMADQKKCAFVGSKNSNKFYPPSCSYAKRIKPENIVCFANSQEALSQGRVQSAGCDK